MIQSRNTKLLRRYYELTEIDRLRFDDTIRKLSNEEFFISETRIIEIIQRFYEKNDYIDS